jgi:hypothetical protein
MAIMVDLHRFYLEAVLLPCNSLCLILRPAGHMAGGVKMLRLRMVPGCIFLERIR